MYIDYKVTTWNRIHFNENTNPKKIIQVIEEKGLGDVFDEELGFVEIKNLYETEEEITPEKNGGCSTIEIYEKNNPVDKLIWSNGKD